MPRARQSATRSRRARAPVPPTPLAAPSATLLARPPHAWPGLGQPLGRQKVGERQPSTDGGYCKSPGTYCSQIGCTWRVCASGRALRGCTGDLAGVSFISHATLPSLHPPPGRRCRHRHASRSPAVPISSRRRRRIPGSPGRHLLARRPPPSRPDASVLRLPALTRPHLATRISLPSPSQWPSGGARKGEAVRIRRVGRSHSGCGSSSSSSGGPPHPVPALEPPRRGARPSTYSPLPRRHRCTSRPGGRVG